VCRQIGKMLNGKEPKVRDAFSLKGTSVVPGFADAPPLKRRCGCISTCMVQLLLRPSLLAASCVSAAAGLAPVC
jgi:hypothetical protein